MDYPLTPTEFINDNIVPVKTGRKCFSGRYNSPDYSGMISRPGADFGYVMAMLGYNSEQKLGFTVNDCVMAVYNAIKDLDGHFYIHTDDTHNDTLPYSIGCSHAFNPTTESVATTYDLPAQDVQEALLLLKNSPDMDITGVTLSGNHDEEGVLIVKSEEFSVNTQDENHMYYVYDKKRDDLFIKLLVEKITLTDLVYENFQRVATLQLGATLQMEAKGLPIFEVIIDESHDIQIRNTGSI
jgi:hypothetical protein